MVLFEMTILLAITFYLVLLSAYLELERSLPAIWSSCSPSPPCPYIPYMGWSIFICDWGQIKSLGIDVLMIVYPWRGMGRTQRQALTAERWQRLGRKETVTPKADVPTAHCKKGTLWWHWFIRKDEITLFFKKGSKIIVLVILPIKHIEEVLLLERGNTLIYPLS